METVKIVFDVDSKDIKSTTDELKALNKVTNDEVVAMQKLSNSAEDAGDGFVSLRTRVKEAKEEAIKAAEKYGEFSKEAQAAKVKAGALADQMGDLNRQVNLLNPEAKAKAFSNLAQGVVGAFSIATGALQAFGVKNKEVEAVAQKLQAALNITQGIASLRALKESYDDIKVVLGFTTAAQEALTVATEAEAVASTEAAVATRGFTAALLTNPIFLAVAAIAALAGAMIALSDDTDGASNSVIDLTEQNNRLKASLDASKESADKVARAMIDLKVAKGEMSEADATIAKNNMDLAKSTESLKSAVNTNKSTISGYRGALIDLKKAYDKELRDTEESSRKSSDVNAARFLAADKKRLKEKYDQDVTNYKSLIKVEQGILAANETTLLNITQETQAKNTEATVNGGKKRTDARTAESEKAKAIAEKAAQEELALQLKLRNQLQENALAQTSDPIEKIKLAKQFANENYALEEQRLKDAGATQLELDNLAAEHTALVIKLNNDEVAANKSKNDKILAAEEKYQQALLALQLAKETDPIKRAQIINDAKEKEIDDKLAIVEKGSKEEQILILEKEKAEIDAAKRIGEAQVEINKNTNDTLQKQDAERLANAKEISEGIFDSANFLGQLAFENRKRETDQELQNLEDQKNQKLITEKQYQEQLRVIKRKQAEDEKKQAIFNATVDLSRAIIAALTIPPPGSFVAAAFAASLAGANLAKIIATPLPKYQKGTLAVPGIDMGRDSVHAMLQPGEAVIPTSTNKAYHPTIRAIYEKKISPSEINNFVMSRTSSGGKQSLTANVDTYALGRALGKNKGVQIENAQVVGKVIARELSNHNIRRA